MSLTFGLSSPRDLLEKAKRELSAFKEAIAVQDKGQVADAIFNFACSVYHVKDWLKEFASASYCQQDVEKFVASEMSLSTCRDICNASKHHRISRYSPTTIEVTASGTPAIEILPSGDALPKGETFRIKVGRYDGSRHEFTALANDAIDKWEGIFQKNGL